MVHLYKLLWEVGEIIVDDQALRVSHSGKNDDFFVGHTAGIRAVIGFHGKVVAELRSAFTEAVDDSGNQ